MAEQKKTTEKPAAEPVKVTLIKNHTHAGRDYTAGETIEVRADQAVWLAEAGVIEKKKEG